jgi:hypothetical protein
MLFTIFDMTSMPKDKRNSRVIAKCHNPFFGLIEDRRRQNGGSQLLPAPEWKQVSEKWGSWVDCKTFPDKSTCRPFLTLIFSLPLLDKW